jgi:chromate transporter
MADDLTRPTFSELTRVFARIGCLSFGGPAGQIALMHRTLVDDLRWVEEQDYLQALNFCHLLPGPEAQQLATYIGWKLHGLRGGLVAGMLFVIPGAIVILGLSALYMAAANLGWFAAIFAGVKAAVLAIIVQAVLRIGGRALQTPFKKGLAILSFAALFLFDAPFPAVIFGAGVIGFAVAAYRPALMAIKVVDSAALPPRPSLWPTLRSIAVWLFIWATPMVLILATLGDQHVLWKIGVFFSQLAVVTFGGAYAVLAYMAQQAVEGFSWLSAGEMADGLGLAETTPGPLIMVTQFVGYIAAFRDPAPFTPVAAALLGAGLTTWVTFAPCFLWIFAFAPWIERLRHARRLQGALAAITAAVVGVIANLGLWFAIHVLFTRTSTSGWPDFSSFDARTALIAAISAVLLFPLKRSIFEVLAASALAGLLLHSFWA